MGILESIGIGSQVLGEIIGADEREAQNDAINAQAMRNEQLQREFAQHGVTWRVEDAKRAGIHPVFALQGGGAAFAPNAITVMGDETGPALSRIGGHLSQRNAQQMALEGAAAQVEKDYAQASYYRALAAKEAQADKSGGTFPSDVVVGASQPSDVVIGNVDIEGRTRLESHPLYADAVKLSPDEMASRRAGVGRGHLTAGGNHPSLREFDFGGGYRALMPATGQGGIPEEIDVAMLPFIIGANIQEYGVSWLTDTLGYWLGASPERRAINRDNFDERNARGWGTGVARYLRQLFYKE